MAHCEMSKKCWGNYSKMHGQASILVPLCAYVLTLETELLVLAGHIMSEQLQGLLHRSLAISPKVCRVFFSHDLHNGFRNEL